MAQYNELIELFGEEVSYRVVRSRRRTIAIEIEPEGYVTVRAPGRAENDEIERFLYEKAQWILGHLARIKDREPEPPPRGYVDNEAFYYLGQEYGLLLVAAGGQLPLGEVRLENGRIKVGVFEDLVDADRELYVREPLVNWYRHQAQAHLPGRAAHFAGLLGLPEPEVIIRHQQKRWGSCSPSGELRFNLRIMMAPPEVVDYVVAHEVCHLVELNHSPRFWRAVESVLPGYRAQRQLLKEQEQLYVL